MIDVLVIGAGPTGLMMAAEAARFGLSCRIIEKSLAPLTQSRALAIQPRTLEIFDHLGIVDRFLAKGLKIHAANPFSFLRRLAHLSLDSLDSPYPFILSLEQTETEKILTEYLSSFGIEIERGKELVDLKQEEDRVTAFLREQESIEAKWVVGCDGAHSLTRKLLDFPFEGDAFPISFSLSDVELDWEYPQGEVFAFLNPEGILAAIPMPGQNRYRLVFQLEKPLERDPTLEDVQKKVNRSVGPGVVVSNPIWMANFNINSRLVKSYRKGRIFLAGDAAHIHSPVGGQGMNSGLQDAFNLGWKLALGKEGVLDTYTLERRSWGEALVKATRRFTKAGTLRNPLLVYLRNLFIRIAMPRLGGKLARAISQTSIQYPKSSIVHESGVFSGGPKAGMRAPNAPVGNTDLYAIMRKTKLPHVLFFGAEKVETEGVVSVEIQDERAFKIYGVKKPSVYLIRPDQYVGYRSTHLESFLNAKTQSREDAKKKN
jgi:2-polyprenyl-6-methoxyphenol hydroxylase-like FAD-dependent oxidoreductase